MAHQFDFSGWATRNNIKCSDGRVIRPNAFIDNDGEEVPMVCQHCHTDPENVLGHALLENRNEGVYCYCWFNKNPKAQATKNAIENGDLKQFSIYANQLVQRGSDVIHGSIKEVSIVMSGANKGARIENLNFAHSDGSVFMDDEEAYIYTEPQKIICHSDLDEEDTEDDDMNNETLDVQAVLDGMDEDQKACLTTKTSRMMTSMKMMKTNSIMAILKTSMMKRITKKSPNSRWLNLILEVMDP